MVCCAFIAAVLSICRSLRRRGEILPHELSPLGSLLKVTAYLHRHPHEMAAVLQYW